MKLSNAQNNYLKAIALRDAAIEKITGHEDDEHPIVKAFEDTLDLVDIREVELFRWAKSHAAVLCAMVGQSTDTLKEVNAMFDRCISGEYVRYELKQNLITLCLKVTG